MSNHPLNREMHDMHYFGPQIDLSVLLVNAAIWLSNNGPIEPVSFGVNYYYSEDHGDTVHDATLIYIPGGM